MAEIKLYSPAIMKKVNGLLPLYGDSNFSDILNRLWMNGADVAKLEQALLTQPGTGNTPENVMAALLEQGIVTEDQIKAAATSYVPPNATQSPWPFRPENVDQRGVVVPVFREPSTKYYPDAPRPVAPAPAPAPAPTPTPTPTVQNVVVPPPIKPEDKKPVTEEEIKAYQATHFGSMLWTRSIPSLDKLLRDAATGQWSPTRFQAELEQTDWWKTNSDTMRSFEQRMAADPKTVGKEIAAGAGLLKATASALGIELTDEDFTALATDQKKFGWNDLQAKQALLGKARYNPEQQGGLGALETKAKSIGKKYLMNISDDEAWRIATKLATGEMTEEGWAQNVAIRAKSAYPSIAQLIDSGTTPADYFSEHVNQAAQLLEVDPESIDLTDAGYNGIVSYADDKGNVRPMTLTETRQFIKKKDEYWKTSNSANEVGGILGSLGAAFGRTGF